MKVITPKEMRSIVDDYQRFFPEWTRVRDISLVRVDGPVLQAITWEASGGTYRPMCFVQVLASPRNDGKIDFFGETPRGRPRIASLRSHARDLGPMIETMKDEFRPSLTEPLVAQRVLDLCESVAVPTSVQAYALAPLNAYLGQRERALAWCRRFRDLVEAHAFPWQLCDQERQAFLELLEQWILAGKEKQPLDMIITEERRKWGLP